MADAVNYANEHVHILWRDDRVLSSVARSQGVATLGMLALIGACVQGNLMAPRQGSVIKAEPRGGRLLVAPRPDARHAALTPLAIRLTRAACPQ